MAPKIKISDQEFEQLVAAGLDQLPAKIKDRISNLAIVIADRPTKDQIADQSANEVLLGLYEGIPLTDRGVNYTGLPDKITIFKQAIITTANFNRDKIQHLVAETVWHEVAHHFGLSEAAVAKREREKFS